VSARRIEVKIVADTREFRRQIARARLSIERSWWRRLLIRIEILRIDREASR
jgi:hypothetical protein